MKKGLLLLLIFMVKMMFREDAVAQKAPPLPGNDHLRIIPPTPDAAKLGQYGELSTNLFNGVPNIQLPLYTIQLGTFKLPLSLDYTSNGIKVDEIASSVGLGWVLNTGGVITASIRGGNDKSEIRHKPADIFKFNPHDQNIPVGEVMSDYEWAKVIISGNYDTQQDIYYYTVNGMSGKFIYDYDISRVIPIPYANIKIDKGGAQIIDSEGNKYLFNARETSNTDERPIIGSKNRPNPTFTVSSLFLEKVITNEGRELLFEYDEVAVTYLQGLSEIRYVQPGGVTGFCPQLTINDKLYANINRSIQRRLRRITSDDGALEINFAYSTQPREDIAFENTRYGNALTKIEIKSHTNLIRRFNFYYDYFRALTYNSNTSIEEQSLNSRLKLTAVEEEGKGKYEFDYEESIKLPARLSFAQDSWGYYNGANNNRSLIPAIYFGGTANRSTIGTYKTGWMISKMTYPTGGYTSFRYEPHMTREQEREITTRTVNIAELSNDKLGARKDFEIAPGMLFNRITIYWDLADDFSQARLTGPGISRTFGKSGRESISLGPGQYSLSIAGRGNASRYIGITGEIDSAYYVWKNIPVGGVRIASMTDFALSGTAVKKYFNYNHPQTGEYSINYNHYPPYNLGTYINRTMLNASPYECQYNINNASSYPELGSDRAELPIGYRHVTVTRDSLGYMGRIRYTFSTKQEDINGDLYTMPDWCRGLNIETVYERYDDGLNTWAPVKKERNVYKTNIHPTIDNKPGYPEENEELVPCFRISYLKHELQPGQGTAIPAEFVYEVFTYNSGWVRLERKEEYTYSSKDGVSLINTEEYSYQNKNHALPTFVKTRNSNNDIITTTKNTHMSLLVCQSMIR
ncbi:hypothetical protein [Chitinophaga sp. MD30]|uniref:hypothetical protein n=1 Tax=Chitinophaga sp. MD30 TaxID=2033437 RepID=UPI000BAFB027|nr:hypothetical protein [Chitinophaga sp. MD30]ASZ12837.1 hypothetical protein CK934_18685 [Chitinophaga sp. MD30]